MKKLSKAIMTIAVIIIFSIAFGPTSHAESLDGLKQERSDVKEERTEVKKDLNKAESNIADVLFDLKELNEEIAQVDEALKHNKDMVTETEETIKQSEKEISGLEEEIKDLEDDIEMRNDILKDRLSSLQSNGGAIGYLDVLLGSESFMDLISRATTITKIANTDMDLVNKQEEDKELVVQKVTEVEGKLEEQEEQKVELKGIQVLITDQQEENDKKKTKLKNKEKELKTMKAELEDKDSSLASLESEIRRDIASVRTSRTANNVASSSQNSSASESDDPGNLVTTASSTPSTPSPSTPNGDVEIAIKAGEKHLGLPYLYAGKSPETGFDCSGFVSWAYDEAGYNIPSSTAGLSTTGVRVPYSQIQRGDLVFFDYTYGGKPNSHVGIYVGNGNFIGAQTSQGMSVVSMTSGYWKSHFNGHVRRIN